LKPHVFKEGEETYCGCAIFVEGGNVIWANCESSFRNSRYIYGIYPATRGWLRWLTAMALPERYSRNNGHIGIKEVHWKKDDNLFAFVNDDSHYAGRRFFTTWRKCPEEVAKHAEEIFYPTPFS